MNRPRAASLLLVGFLASCRKAEPEKPPEKGAVAQPKHADEKQHEDLPRMVKLTPEVVREAKVRTESARKQRLAATVELSGQIVANPEALAMLGARTTGRVLRALVREGDRVRAGQTVALISSSEVAKLRGEHAAMQARAASARENAARLRELFLQRLGSEQEAVTAEAEATAVEAERDASARTLRGLGAPAGSGQDSSLVPLVTPIAGTVVQLDAAAGQMIEPTHTVATVADLSRVWFQAQVFEKDLARIVEGAPAEVRLNGYPEHVFTARVTRLSGQVDPQARTVMARIALNAADNRLRLGLFGSARVSVPSGDQAEVLAVPLSAVTDLGERKAVFVRHPDGDFELHEVRVGAGAGGMVEILSGLEAGEQVVVSGVHTLKSAVLKGTMEEE
jgi:cobalt-zinc-cadmium efflux system membrane fusion protein